MKRIILITLLVVGLLATPVAAQETTSTPATSSTNQTSTPEPAKPTYAGEIDPATRIVDYRIEGGTLTLTLESDIPQIVVLTDSYAPLDEGAGVSNIPQKRTTIPKGRSEVTISAESYQGEIGVAVATTRGAVFISSGDIDNSSPFNGLSGGQGLFAGVFIAFGMTTLAGYRYMKREGGSPESGFKE
jgi:hypothetical protein